MEVHPTFQDNERLSLTGGHFADKPTAEELKEASRQFESIFLRQFVEEALKPVLHAGPGAETPGGDVYQYFVAEAIADSLSQSQSFGFSNLLQMQLTGEEAGAQKPNKPIEEPL